jgi:hypothetical protein
MSFVKKILKPPSKGGKAPKAPDYTALALQQHDLDQQAADRAAAANRVNQYSPDGSLEYAVDPVTGQWSQTKTLSDSNKALYDQEQARKSQIAGATGDYLNRAINATSKPLDLESLTGVRAYDTSGLHDYGADLNPNADQMTKFDPTGEQDWGSLDYSKLGDMPESGFGAVQEVQDAWMARLQPQMDTARQREIQRLKAQGFSETDEGFGSTMDRRNQTDVDARNEALKQAVGAYGDVFNRGMAVRKQGAGEMLDEANFANATRTAQSNEQLAGNKANNDILGKDFDQQQLASAYANSLRGQQLSEQGVTRAGDIEDRTRELKEQQLQRTLPMTEYQNMAGMTQAVNPQFEDYSQVAGAKAADVAGAAASQYGAAANTYNQKEAANAAMMQGLLSTAGSVVGGIYGGPWGAAAGGAAGRYLAPTANQADVPYYWAPSSSAAGGYQPVGG